MGHFFKMNLLTHYSIYAETPQIIKETYGTVLQTSLLIVASHDNLCDIVRQTPIFIDALQNIQYQDQENPWWFVVAQISHVEDENSYPGIKITDANGVKTRVRAWKDYTFFDIYMRFSRRAIDKMIFGKNTTLSVVDKDGSVKKITTGKKCAITGQTRFQGKIETRNLQILLRHKNLIDMVIPNKQRTDMIDSCPLITVSCSEEEVVVYATSATQ